MDTTANNNAAEVPASTPADSPATPVTPPAVAVRAEVAERLSSVSPMVRELVITELTTQEINKRKEAVLSLLSKFDEKTKELKKAEGVGAFTYNAAGDKVGEPIFTKEQAEAIKKTRDEVAKISAALSDFFDKNETKKLYELSK